LYRARKDNNGLVRLAPAESERTGDKRQESCLADRERELNTRAVRCLSALPPPAMLFIISQSGLDVFGNPSLFAARSSRIRGKCGAAGYLDVKLKARIKRGSRVPGQENGSWSNSSRSPLRARETRKIVPFSLIMESSSASTSFFPLPTQ
jgi:hypothetical protein